MTVAAEQAVVLAADRAAVHDGIKLAPGSR